MEPIKITVLDAATLGEDTDLSPLKMLGEVTVHPLTARGEVSERIADCDVCVINKIKMDGEVLASASHLKLICVTATGYDNIDTEYCGKRGIAVCNIAGYSTDSVAQLTLAMVLSASVHLPAYRRLVADGTYTAGNVQNMLTPVYHELMGKTWGIIGYGGIGKRVGEVAETLGCRVVVNKCTPVEGVTCLRLDELLSCSDIVTVHVPLTDATRGMIGERELALMKDGVLLVNVARGAVLDEEAVVRAVESGKLGFFGCDVYSTEPMPASHPYFRIRSRENVCFTPHMAWGAYEARQRCIREIAENIRTYLCGERRNRVV